MAIEICLTIQDDGTMTVSQEDVTQEAGENETEEQGAPVDSIDQALEMIRQLAEESATMQPPDESQVQPDDQGAAPEDEEALAMEQNFKQR